MTAPRSRTVVTTVLMPLLVTLLTTLLVTLLPDTAQAQRQDDYQRQARTMTNNKRDAHDVKKLAKADCVQKFARRQARHMAKQDLMFHQDLGVVLNKCNLTAVGENVAYGYDSGRAVVKAWMNSPGHRANLLSPTFGLLGMAVRRSEDGTPYAAQVFGRK